MDWRRGAPLTSRQDSENVHVIALLSGWGCGSTAVAGFLQQCGAFSCPPHWRTNDERTPVSYEPAALRAALVACFDEPTLAVQPPHSDFRGAFSRWLAGEKQRAASKGCTRIVLKHPLLCLVVRELEEVASPDFVIVTRPFDAIEATRKRRGWLDVHGASGAGRLYNAAYVALHEGGLAHLGLPFNAFRRDEALQDSLLAYCGLEPTAQMLDAARGWLR